MRVSGSSRDPVPPARTTPFMGQMLLRAEPARYAVLISPRDDIERVHSELEEVFNVLWHGPRFTVPRRGFRPHLDVVRTEEPDELRVTVDLAGVDPADVHVAVHERALLIAGQ